MQMNSQSVLFCPLEAPKLYREKINEQRLLFCAESKDAKGGGFCPILSKLSFNLNKYCEILYYVNKETSVDLPKETI